VSKCEETEVVGTLSGKLIYSLVYLQINSTNKTCKDHKLLLFTELIFCNNPKANEKKSFFCC